MCCLSDPTHTHKGANTECSLEDVNDDWPKRELCKHVVERYQKFVLYQQYAAKDELKAKAKPMETKKQKDKKQNSYTSSGNKNKTRVSQSDKWRCHFQKLLMFRKKNGHSVVPCVYDDDPSLSRWVRRQRFHYYLMLNGKPSSMKPDRIKMLDDIGFVWHAREAQWHEQFNELLVFKKAFGHCAIPTIFAPNQKLATWAKLQRRQYRLYKEGRPSYISEERIALLEKHGFRWKLSS